ncbi:MAG: hypothetical protein RQ899_01755 [Pseudomonadales bacterium]|nr:hypothetical protein [Pseudomonadales bacterium]
MQKFLRDNFLILILMNFNSFLTYALQIYVSRLLDAGDFGAFNALNAFVTICSAPLAVVPLLYTRYTVKYEKGNLGVIKRFLSGGIKTVIVIYAIILLAGILGAAQLKDYFHLNSTLPMFIVLAQLLVVWLYPMFQGVMQGLRRYAAYGMSNNGAMLASILGVGLLVHLLDWGINGALLAGLIGSAVLLAVSLWFVKDVLSAAAVVSPEQPKTILRYAIPVTVANIFYSFLGNLDIILVRHYCAAEDAGLYVTASILAKTAVFLPGVLKIVLFPEAARMQDAGEGQRHHLLWISMGLTALLSGVIALVFFLWPQELLGLFFGSRYEGADEMLRVLSAAMALLGITNVIFTYRTARSEFSFLWPLSIGAILMIVQTHFYHADALEVAKIVLSSISLIFVICLLMEWWGRQQSLRLDTLSMTV